MYNYFMSTNTQFRITCRKCGKHLVENESYGFREEVRSGVWIFDGDDIDTSGMECPTCEFSDEELEEGFEKVEGI
jgi:hypothetical protein